MASGQRFRVRRATVGDVEILVQQRRGMWENMGVKDRKALTSGDVVYRRWARKRLKDGTLLGWLVEARGGTIAGGGCLWLQPIQPRPGRSEGLQPYLLSMFTVPAFRGKGVASRVVREAAKWARKNGYPSLRLHASEMGRGVYRRHGFKRTWEMRLDMASR